nr:hypothetical protein CFP56_62392 [Quercus suber]
MAQARVDNLMTSRIHGGHLREPSKRSWRGRFPGAYAKAFDFLDLMDMGAESDDEVEELHEGLVVAKLTRKTKLQIRKPWSNALVIKLYGRAVGFNFLQSKLNLLWKPFGRIEFVDLSKDFYSVKFSVKEDMDASLKMARGSLGAISYPFDHRSRFQDSLCKCLIHSGSGTTNVREIGTEDDRYDPWMLVSRRKLMNNRTKNVVAPRDSTSSGMRQTPLGLRQGFNKGLMGWAETNRSFKDDGPLRAVVISKVVNPSMTMASARRTIPPWMLLANGVALEEER